MRYLLLLGLALLLASGVTLVAAEPDNGYQIPRWVIGGGGGESAVGGYALVGTAGQPLTDAGSGAGYEICSGFWCGAGQVIYDYAVYLPLVLRNYP